VLEVSGSTADANIMDPVIMIVHICVVNYSHKSSTCIRKVVNLIWGAAFYSLYTYSQNDLFSRFESLFKLRNYAVICQGNSYV